MDIALLKTFLEVSATGSFGAASERLFVTQSAVSLRIQRLEEQLGRPLFTRSKAGAELTSAGREFEVYALALLQTWEKARQQIAIPSGFTRTVTIGAQYSLWPRLGFRLIDDLRRRMPDLSIRAELGMPDRLTRLLAEGTMQVALVYSPTLRPGLTVEPLMEEELILCAPWPDPTLDQIRGRYAFIDWGPEFVTWHQTYLPDLTNPGLTLVFGAMAAQYVSRRGLAGFLPARTAMQYFNQGLLHPVDHSPVFPYPVWSIYREDLQPEIAMEIKTVLKAVTEGIETETHDVLERLLHEQESAGKHKF